MGTKDFGGVDDPVKIEPSQADSGGGKPRRAASGGDWTGKSESNLTDSQADRKGGGKSVPRVSDNDEDDRRGG